MLLAPKLNTEPSVLVLNPKVAMPDVFEPTRIVDLHAHLFNARCMPLAGVIANLFNEDAHESALARGASKLINLLTRSESEPPRNFSVSYFAQEKDCAELVANIALSELGLLRSTIELSPEPLRKNAFVENDQADLVAIKADPIYQAVLEIEQALLTMQGEDVGKNKSYWISASSGLIGLALGTTLQEVGERIKKVIVAMLKCCEEAEYKLDDFGNFAKFCLSMMCSVHTHAESLFQRYGDLKQPITIVHHMMDMEWAYVVNGTTLNQVHPKYDYASEQVSLMSQIGKEYEGKIIGFAAFDPRHDNWKELANEAIKTRGFTGFKFYPAMGYLPFGKTNVMGREDPVSQAVIAQRVKDFFLWCVTDQSVPVFTHCTPLGFETRFREGLNTSPKYWRALLESDAKLKNLRLCFGHGGGGQAIRKDPDSNGTMHTIRYQGWTADNGGWVPGNFAYDVAAMCREFPNVFCELAYITELIERSADEQEVSKVALQRNLKLAVEGSGDYKFLDKVAYGSDWNMPSMVDHPRAYLEVFLGIFKSNPVLNPATERFFWANSYRYLGL